MSPPRQGKSLTTGPPGKPCLLLFNVQELPCISAYFIPNTPQETAAAAAAKSLQSCPTLCDPIGGSQAVPPWDSPGKNTGVG